MIAFLEGTLAGKTSTAALLNVGGVGFEVGMSQRALSKLPSAGDSVLVHTYLQVRDDGMSLYGFQSIEEKALFERLITVSGVGPKVALAALSMYDPDKLVELIAAQDVTAVQRIPGIGKEREGAVEALLSMGFTSAEADLALKDAPDGASEAALLQYALKKLGS